MLQIKQRQSWKPRFLVWGGVYGGLAALLVDAIAVFCRGQKSIANELITFGAVGLAAPLAYVATTGTLTPTVLGLWALCSLYFCCTIFTVKLRKPHRGEPDSAPIWRAIAYHGMATLLVVGLYGVGLLPPMPALAFGLAVVKGGAIAGQLPRFRQAPVGVVAAIETTMALLFGAVVAVALLPAHAPVAGLY